MFRGWNFLLGEIWVLIALAALLGLVVGWLVWGRREVVTVSGDVTAPGDDGEARRLAGELEVCRAQGQDAAARIAALETQLAAAQVAPVEPGPVRLSAPKGGQADDLKRIKGVGPKLEGLLNQLGFWHFDQIASWTEADIAWVDENLETFKGRVTRDDWVAQAKVLAAGGVPD